MGLTKDLTGSDVMAMNQEDSKNGKGIPLGELYFDVVKLKKMLNNIGIVGKDGNKKLEGYVNRVLGYPWTQE